MNAPLLAEAISCPPIPALRIGRLQRWALSALSGQRILAESMMKSRDGVPKWVVVKTRACIGRGVAQRLVKAGLLQQTRDAGRWREYRLTDAGERAALLPPPSPRRRKVR